MMDGGKRTAWPVEKCKIAKSERQIYLIGAYIMAKIKVKVED